jgi:hypothetical protein
MTDDASAPRASRGVLSDGATKRCPQCRDTLVFTSRHPMLASSLRIERSGGSGSGDIQYERAWVCRNDRCDYRELAGDA